MAPSGNGIDGVRIDSGVVAQDVTWRSDGSLPFVVTGQVSVMEGFTLTVLSGFVDQLGGAIIKFAGAGISVNGELAIWASPCQTITLTSFKDDSVGGDTNNDGNASVATPGDWRGIYNGTPVQPNCSALCCALPAPATAAAVAQMQAFAMRADRSGS